VLTRNPELVRHVRAAFRPTRVVMLVSVVAVLCTLLWLWSGSASGGARGRAYVMYTSLVWAQFVVLGVWCASACSQAVSRERELKTWDFVRTTRLTAVDILVGKLLGAPILAYAVLACVVPVALGAGLVWGIGPDVLLQTYVLLAAYLTLVGLLGLLASMLAERTSAAAVAFLALALLWPVEGQARLAGWSAVGVVRALETLYGGAPRADFTPVLLGMPVPTVLPTVVVYAVFGAWIVVMLARNLKKDLDQMQLLSRWQAVGLATSVHVLFFAVLDPRVMTEPAGAARVALAAVLLGAGMLLLAGLAMLGSHERLREWWRRRQAGQASYLADDGLPWPWLVVTGAVGYAVLVVAAVASGRFVPLDAWRLTAAGLALVALGAFIVRDVLFLQWCLLTRLRQPVIRGFLYLALYYVAAWIVAAALGWTTGPGRVARGLLTPLLAFEPEPGASLQLYAGLLLQAAASVVIARAITARLSRPPRAVLESPAQTRDTTTPEDPG
jgi:hypothetical protein